MTTNAYQAVAYAVQSRLPLTRTSGQLAPATAKRAADGLVACSWHYNHPTLCKSMVKNTWPSTGLPKGGERCFCRNSGSNLFWRTQALEHVSVMAGAINEEDQPTSMSQLFIDKKPGYFNFANQTTMEIEADISVE